MYHGDQRPASRTSSGPIDVCGQSSRLGGLSPSGPALPPLSAAKTLRSVQKPYCIECTNVLSSSHGPHRWARQCRLGIGRRVTRSFLYISTLIHIGSMATSTSLSGGRERANTREPAQAERRSHGTEKDQPPFVSHFRSFAFSRCFLSRIRQKLRQKNHPSERIAVEKTIVADQNAAVKGRRPVISSDFRGAFRPFAAAARNACGARACGDASTRRRDERGGDNNRPVVRPAFRV